MTLFVGIDWAKDGTYTGPYDDVTARARGGRAGSVRVSYGRAMATDLAVSGSGSLVLNNSDRVLSPRNTSSPLYGKIRPARPVLVQRTIGATTYTIFRGRTDHSALQPDLNSRSVGVNVVDALADFKGQTISTRLYRGLRTGLAVGLILDAIGWTGGRDLDVGATFMPWWWLSNVDALSALQDIVSSEGPPALLTVGSSGEIIFRDRHHRLLKTRSLTSQSTWRGSGGEPVMQSLTYDDAWSSVVNAVAVSVDSRAPSAFGVVWTSTETVYVDTGETKLVTVSTSDPFTNAVVPDSTDIVATGTVTAALTRTSGGTTTIRLTAVGGPARVTGLRLRAIPIPVVRQYQLTSTDPDSATEFGPRGYDNALTWCGPDDAQAVIDTVVAQRAQPLAQLTVRFQIGGPVNTGRAAALLALNLSDRVTVIEPETGLSADFHIESITHELTGEEDHTITFGLEQAPTLPTPVFRFGVSGQGFNDGVFGGGLDDPNTIFLFDGGSGHRFSEGVFAT